MCCRRLSHVEMSRVKFSWLLGVVFQNHTAVPDVVLAAVAKKIEIEPLEAKEVLLLVVANSYYYT